MQFLCCFTVLVFACRLSSATGHSRKFVNAAFEDRIARELAVDVTSARQKMTSLLGLCSFETRTEQTSFVACQAGCVAEPSCLALTNNLDGGCGHCIHESEQIEDHSDVRKNDMLLSVDTMKIVDKSKPRIFSEILTIRVDYFNLYFGMSSYSVGEFLHNCVFLRKNSNICSSFNRIY